MGRLDIRICEARNLKNTETFGIPDPYCKVVLEGQEHKTSTQSDTLNPKWDQVFKFQVADPQSAVLHFTIWNKDTFSADDFMGEYQLTIAGLTRGQVYDQWLLLRNTQKGELRVRLCALDFGNDAAPPAAPYYPPPPPTYVPPPTIVVPSAPQAPTYMPPNYQVPVFYPPQPVVYPPSVQPPTIDQPTQFKFHVESHCKWSQPAHGALFHEDGTGRVLLLMDEHLRHVPNPEVFFALFNKPLDANALNRFPAGSLPHPEGEPIPHDARLVRPEGEPEVYFLDRVNGQQVRRWVCNAGIFENLNFNWGKVQVVDPSTIMPLPAGHDIPKTPSDGCLFHDDDTGRVYLFLDGGLRHVQNPESYYRLFEIGLDANNFKRFRGPLVYPIIHPIPTEAGLVRPDGFPHVFLIDLQRGRLVKRHITDQTVFFQHNFHFNDVHVQPQPFFHQYPAGTPIGPETPMPADGRLYYNEHNGAVQLLVDYELRHIPNEQVYGRLFSVPLDPNSFHRYNLYAGFAEGDPIHPNTRFIRASGEPAVYFLDTQGGRQVRRHIKNEAVMARNRFKWEAVEERPAAEVNSYPIGAPML